jgi:hypothetical protein
MNVTKPSILSAGAGLYCGVTDKFVTPNLNEANLSMEYVAYSAKQVCHIYEAIKCLAAYVRSWIQLTV